MRTDSISCVILFNKKVIKKIEEKKKKDQPTANSQQQQKTKTKNKLNQ